MTDSDGYEREAFGYFKDQAREMTEAELADEREALDALALRLRPYLSDAQWDDLCASRRPPDRYVRISLAGARSPSLALNYLADREPRYPPPGASQPDYRLRGTLGDVEMLLPHDWVDAAEWRLEGV